MTAQWLIDKLELAPLPGEGGFYRETYRSEECMQRGTAHKNASTAIYFLLTAETKSALHRLPTDEVFHFYLGDTVEMVQIDKTGKLKRVRLGSSLVNDEKVQVLVPAGVWQGSALVPGGKWALMGTTMAPGFDFSDLELATEELAAQYPTHRETIEALLP